MNAEALARFLKARLVDARAQDDWVSLMEGAWNRLRAEPVQTFLGEPIEALVEAYLEPERLVSMVRPVVQVGVRQAVVQARLEDEPVGRWVPEGARARLKTVAARAGLVDPRWIDHVFEQKAMEEVVTDTLYRALEDFSTIVPRIVQSVTPSAIGKLAKLGGRATGGVGGRMLDELNRRLEQEIRRWLDKGSRRALDGAARFTIDHIDDPVSIEARRNTIDFALAQSPAFHVAQVDDEMIEALDAVAEAIARRVAEEDASKRIADGVLARLRADYDGKTLGQVLDEAGLVEPPPFEAWGRATWPLVRTVFASAEVEALIDRVAEEAAEALG